MIDRLNELDLSDDSIDHHGNYRWDEVPHGTRVRFKEGWFVVDKGPEPQRLMQAMAEKSMKGDPLGYVLTIYDMGYTLRPEEPS